MEIVSSGKEETWEMVKTKHSDYRTLTGGRLIAGVGSRGHRMEEQVMGEEGRKGRENKKTEPGLNKDNNRHVNMHNKGAGGQGLTIGELQATKAP